jgi:DNA polymerase-3 subunit delta'
LPTLRSRCFYWHLATPEASLAAQWIARQLQVAPLSIQTALRLGEGTPLAALELLQPERWKQREQLCQQVSASFQQRCLLSLLPQLNHDDAVERLFWLCSLLLDVIKYQQGAGHYVINLDQQPLIAALANTLSNEALQQNLQGWMRCRQQLLSVVGVNRELLLTEQLLEWENSL